jgi:hypothetical protein
MNQLRCVVNWGVVVLLAVACGSSQAGTYKTITIDSDFSDWVGVPVVDSDGGDNAGGPDIGDTQIANDNDFLYIRNSFPNGLSLGTFMTIDIDNNLATGFDVFSLGLIGAEVGWQNDFPFTLANGTFNDGQGMTGDFFGSGAALLDAFANGNQRELAISRSITRNIDGSAVFTGDPITILFWTDLGVGADGLPSFDPGDSGDNYDVSAVIHYTFAVPEPAAMLLGLTCLAGTLARPVKRRRR